MREAALQGKLEQLAGQKQGFMSAVKQASKALQALQPSEGAAHQSFGGVRSSEGEALEGTPGGAAAQMGAGWALGQLEDVITGCLTGATGAPSQQVSRGMPFGCVINVAVTWALQRHGISFFSFP